MVAENQYEPKLTPITQADVQGETEVAQAADNNGLNLVDVTRASNDGTQRRDVQAEAPRIDVSDIKDPDIKNAFALLDKTYQEATLLYAIENSGYKFAPNDPVEVSDGKGGKFVVTIAQLRDSINQSSEALLGFSQLTRAKYEAASLQTDANLNARNKLAQELGFPVKTLEVPDPNAQGQKRTITTTDVSKADIDERLAKTSDAGQRAKLEELKGLLTKYDSVQKERHALSLVDVTVAEMMRNGLTHKAGEQLLDGQNVTRREAMSANEILMRAARSNPQLELTSQYKDQQGKASELHSTVQNERSRAAMESLKAADELRQAGKIPEAQAKYEEALKKVNEVDLASVTVQWRSQMKEYETVQKQREALGNPPTDANRAATLDKKLREITDVGLQLEDSIKTAKDVKVEYARFLNEQNKSGEALPLLTGVASQIPQEFLAEDASFNEQMEKAQNLGSITSGDAEKHRALYEQAMTAKDWTTAERELAALKAASSKASDQSLTQAKDRLAVMDKRQAEIKTELEALKKNTTMEAEAKALRQQQLEAESKGYDALRKPLADGIPAAEKAAQEHMHKLRYMEGIIAFSKDDKDAAHKIFKELEAEAPEIASNKDYQLDALLEDTRHKGWLERHWDTIVSVGKIVAVGAAIIAATVITAPIGGVGGIAAAAALGAGLGAAGVFGAGAIGHVGARALDYKSTDNYHNWRPLEDLKTGAIQGGLGAGIGKLFAVGGGAALGENLVARGTQIAANAGGRTFASTTLTASGRLVSGGTHILANATNPMNALKLGATYGFGSEGLNAIQGKGFHVEDALLKTAGMTGGLYGAGRTGGLMGWGGLTYAGAMTGQETLGNYIHGKEIDLGETGMSFLGHTTTALTLGGFAKLEAAAAAGKFTIRPINPDGVKQGFNWQTVRNFPGAFKDGTVSNAKFFLGEGMGVPAHAKYWGPPAVAAGAFGLTRWQDSNYEASRTAKPWDTEDGMTRMRMNQSMEVLSKPVKRPVVKQPGQP